MHESNDFIGQLFAVPSDGGLSEQLPLPRGGFCSFSPDGKKLAYNRVFREFRTWKRYRGGRPTTSGSTTSRRRRPNVANEPGDRTSSRCGRATRSTSLSDRDDIERMNLYAVDLATKQTRKLTNFTEFDIKFPSLGDNAIVFENGGYIYRFDLADREGREGADHRAGGLRRGARRPHATSART